MTEALSALEVAIDLGYDDLDHLLSDPDLARSPSRRLPPRSRKLEGACCAHATRVKGASFGRLAIASCQHPPSLRAAAGPVILHAAPPTSCISIEESRVQKVRAKIEDARPEDSIGLQTVPRVGIILEPVLGGLAGRIEERVTIPTPTSRTFPSRRSNRTPVSFVCGTLSACQSWRWRAAFISTKGYSMQEVPFPCAS